MIASGEAGGRGTLLQPFYMSEKFVNPLNLLFLHRWEVSLLSSKADGSMYVSLNKSLASFQVLPVQFCQLCDLMEGSGPDDCWDPFHFLRSQIPNKASPNSLLPSHLLSLSHHAHLGLSSSDPEVWMLILLLPTTPESRCLPSLLPLSLLMPQQFPCFNPWPCRSVPLISLIHSRPLERLALIFLYTPPHPSNV